jgi:hypothetical protein
MSGMEERLARAIAGQYRARSWEWIGECDKDEYRAVAAGVIEELGLTEEWDWRVNTDEPDRFSSPEEAVAHGYDRPTERRFVSRWETP